MEQYDRSKINEESSGSMDDREEEEEEEESNSDGDEDGSVEEENEDSEAGGDNDNDDDDESSDDESSDEEEEEDDEEEDESSDEEGGHDEPIDGLSEYERLRLQRIARNQARLSSLGLHKISNEMKKSKEKKQQQKRTRQPTFDGPRRQLPGRSARATSFFIAEQSKKVVKSTATPSPPKQKKIKKNVDACWTCQEDTGELHMCDFCRKLYHSTCDSNLNNEDAASDDFKCTICEKEGKNRRVPCGRCEGCTREWDCETCVFCRRKMAADEEASVRQKCIFRKCRNWGMRATVSLGVDGDEDGDDGRNDEESDDGHDAECNVCHVGGDLICCDGCPRVFHSDCHKPKIHTLPDGEWFCMHCNAKKPKAPKEKKSKYFGPLLADLGEREVSCVVHFPTLECLVCEGIEVTGAKKELDWTTCKICDDSFHLQCLDPPLEQRPTNFRCLSCKESKRRGIPKEKKTKPLFEGVHDDDCYICRNGGNLVCCDFCEKAFHCECHIPPLPGVPTTATWKCCECAALEYKRKFRCGDCKSCKVKEDCGKCYSCVDKPKFGGPGLHKQGCEKRKCPYMRFAPPANANESKSKRKHFLMDGDESPKKHKNHKKKKKLKKLKTREERLMEISAQASDDIDDVDYDAFINRKKIKGDPVGNMIRLIMKKAFEMAHDAEVQEMACEHLCFIAKTADNVERAIKLGALKMVSKAMNDHPEKSSVQSEAAAFLAQVVWVHPPCIITILREGCLPLVLKSMDFHDKNVQVCTSAISVFRAMSYDFSNHWICNNINATASIIVSMKTNQSRKEVLKEGCLFLQNIICNNEISSDTIDLIISHGTVQIIVGAMSPPADSDLIECACGLLGNLAIDDDISEEIGKNSSSIPVLLGILATTPGEDVTKSALIALKRISTDNEDNTTKIVEQDGVSVTLDFLKGRSSDIDLLATGFGLLYHLTKNKSNTNSQPLDFVIAEMRNHSDLPHIQSGTCSVIRNLSVDDIEQAKVAKALVVAAMNRHQQDSRVQFEGCQALLNLYGQFPSIVEPLRQQESLLSGSQSPKRKRRKVEKRIEDEQGADTTDRTLEKNALGAKIIPEIKHVLRPLKKAPKNDVVGDQIRLIIITALRNLDNYKLQTAACEHLRFLVTSIKNCSTIVKLGGLKMIHISVNQHPRKTVFVAEAINLLLDLISVSPSVVASIVQEGLLDLVIESMYSNGHNSKVQQPSLGIFRAMSYDFTKHSDIQNVKGVEEVIETMKRIPKKYAILKDVYIILQNFLSNKERRQETLELITSLNVIPVVVDGMYSNGDIGFLAASSGLLTSLAMDEEAKMAISDYVLSIKTLLAVLELNNIDADVSMSTLTALRLLLTDNQENKRKTAESGGVKTVADFLTAPREVIVAESGLELLAEMIKNNAENSEQLKKCGGIRFVTSLMKGKPRSSSVQAAGCRILCTLVTIAHLSNGVSTHPIQVEGADDALKLVLSVMKSHRNDNSVQLEGSRALLHFCTLFPSLTESLDSSILCQSSFRVGIFSY